jgi:upstream activation factor subunit UAF30
MKEPAKKPAAKAAATAAPKKAPATKVAKPKVAGAPSAFSKPLTPSKELAAVVGAAPLPRTEVVSKVWEYIKKHKLQNEANKREIIADDKLKAVFEKDKVTMFEMNKYLAKHLKN